VVERRVDRIERRLRALGGRAHLQQLIEEIRGAEGKPDVSYQSVYIAIQLENQRLDELGERTRFMTSRDGEERGWIGKFAQRARNGQGQFHRENGIPAERGRNPSKGPVTGGGRGPMTR
jgi:hypothetical protein